MMTADEEIDRLLQLLDVATDAYRKGDTDTTKMALAAAEESALRLDTNPIRLPDRSGEKL